ncbi:MAG: hypothetical protein ACJAV7_002754 [Flavobacteriales bacterium]|jgi:hypothetical protein
MRRILLLLLIITPIASFSTDVVKKSINASRIAQTPKIDGVLDDAAWAAAEVVSGFIQTRPNPGNAASQETEIRLIYDDEAIYIGAIMHDSAPDSILHQMSERDQLDNTDFFGLWFGCFQDGINAFEFITTPDGVQFDAQVSAFGEDTNWNAVWQCNTQITETGWVAEMKIPYSALRFPKQEVQSWDVNFMRTIRRHREQSFWQHVDPAKEGFINQSGQIEGLTNIVPPARVFFYPYASGYVEVADDANGASNTGFSYNAGMDVKIGLSDAFTLDMTLIPDFGQVQSDNQVLNLSPFEVRFNENRAFFTEGTELFNKGNVFYSRRVGGQPVNGHLANDALGDNEIVKNLPSATQLLNATKISGRLKKGLGIGVFNAVTGNEYATLKDTISGTERDVRVSPLTNYSIITLDQNLKNNSYVALVNTNVLRNGSTYDANVTATEFSLRNKANSLQIEGGAKYSKKFNWGDNESDDGYAYSLALNKTGGQVEGGVGGSVESKFYDPNDLGFLYNANEMQAYAWMSYNIYEPFGGFNNLWSSATIWYGALQDPAVYTGWGIEGDVGVNTRNFFTFGANFDVNPGEGRDYFEPRVDGRSYVIPENYSGNVWFSTDYRKMFAVDVNVDAGKRLRAGMYGTYFRIAPRLRASDKLMFTYVWSMGDSYNDQGWALHAEDTDNLEDGDVVFSSRDVNTITNVLSAKYIFTNRMGLTFRLRHYWSNVDIKSFHLLGEDGYLYDTEFNAIDDQGNSDYDKSFNAFNIDMVYTWVFAPGSELSVVWKNSIIDFSESIPDNWARDFEQTIDQPQVNSISIKALYFIDYYSLTKKGRSNKVRN